MDCTTKEHASDATTETETNSTAEEQQQQQQQTNDSDDEEQQDAERLHKVDYVEVLLSAPNVARCAEKQMALIEEVFPRILLESGATHLDLLDFVQAYECAHRQREMRTLLLFVPMITQPSLTHMLCSRYAMHGGGPSAAELTYYCFVMYMRTMVLVKSNHTRSNVQEILEAYSSDAYCWWLERPTFPRAAQWLLSNDVTDVVNSAYAHVCQVHALEPLVHPATGEALHGTDLQLVKQFMEARRQASGAKHTSAAAAAAAAEDTDVALAAAAADDEQQPEKARNRKPFSAISAREKKHLARLQDALETYNTSREDDDDDDDQQDNVAL